MTNLTEGLPVTSGRPRTRRSSRNAARIPRPGLALAVVLTGQIMAVIDTNIVNVAVPAMHATLGASGAGLQLVVAGYVIAYAVDEAADQITVLAVVHGARDRKT